MSKGLDPDQDQHSVGPDLGPNCKGYQQMKNNLPLTRKEIITVTH